MSWWRRCALFTALVFGLSVAVPSQVVQPEHGGFPLAWVADMFRFPRAWAAVGGLPRQEKGRPGPKGYVPASATTANGGSGRAPHIRRDGLDGYQPYTPSAGTTKTKARRGYVAGTSTRQADKSGANMDEYANADGSVTRIYSNHSNYRGADGTWQKIDPTLVQAGHGRWKMKENSLQVSLAGNSADSAGSSAPLASMTLSTGDTVGYDLKDAAAVTPTVTGSTATYASILPGTDLELQAFATGIKETLVLDSPSAANEWVFPLRLTGLTPRAAADGSVELVDASGTATARFPHGSMSDSKFNPQSGDMARSSAVSMQLTTVDGVPALHIVADRTWLDDPARVYPVRVDPTVTTGDTGDVYVDNDTTTTSTDQNGDNLPVGTYNGGTTKARSFIHFDDFNTSGVTGMRVTGASLKLYLTWQYACTVSRPFYVHTATQSWTVAGLSTSSYPGPSVSTDPIGSLTVADSGPACTNTAANRSVGEWVTVPLNVATFNDWSSGGSNLGLALLSSVTDSYAWKRFTAANYSAGTYKPQLSLTYTSNVLPQVDTRYPANNTTVETLTPQLVTRAHDPDAYPNKGLTYTYTVYNSAGTVVVSSGAVTTSTWQVPAGKLAWDNTYYYTVKVGDKVGTSAESAQYAITTPVPQPRLTSDLAENPGVGFDPNNGNYTTSATDAEVAGVGPALEISRSYNSLDTRRTGAFGQGWSSILDTKATQRLDATGAVQTVVVTYPNGSEVAFGRNTDGTFTPPSGRYATFTVQTSGTTVTGYTLTDKDATQYVFGRAAGSGVFQVTSIIDANGRALTFAYDGTTGLLSSMTNAAGRKLTLTWATSSSPTVGTPHVASVTTDAPTAGGTAYTWTYAYGTYDRLTTVCPPGTTTACTVYTWANANNQYANAVLNLNPYSFWRLNDASSPSAESSVLTNAGVDNGTYKNVTLGGAAALPDSASPSAGFNGTSSSVQLPGKLVNDGSYQSLSMWFKTTTPGGVLFSYSGSAITAGTTSGNYVPALYVDKNGYLRGQFWQNAIGPIKSPSVVTDGAWHQVVLSGAGSTQTMYVDGVAAGSLAGTIALFQTTGSAYEYLGAGFVGGGWPDLADTGASPAVARYFNGSISDVAFYTKTLTAADVSGVYSVAKNSSSAIQQITSPAGRVQAQVAVSNVTGQVTSVTDENGGVWTMGEPTVVGSSDVYAAKVLGAKPVNYWRLGETGADVTDAVNEVAGDTATYSSVTLGDSGPFTDSTAATFDGIASNVALPGTVAPAGASSVGVWFSTTATGKVLLGSQGGALGDTTAPGLPTLWISSDGKLRGLSPSTTPTGPLRSGIAGKCADVDHGGTVDGTKIQIWSCNGTAPQNWTMYADGTIRALGKCMDITNAGTANSTKIQLLTCNGNAAQVWEPYNGGLRNPISGKCLADPASSTTDGAQLIIYTCMNIDDQKWPMSLVSSAAVNDGKWHQAVLTSSGTTQTLYVDNVKTAWTTGTVALNPGNQPYAYLGAGFTGTGWSGLTPSTTSYYSGKLAEAAFYTSELTPAQVDEQWSASKQTVPVAVTTVDTTVKTVTMPVKKITVTDPDNKVMSYSYDLINSREVAETDALGNTTSFGYDTGGFSSLVYDPNGVRTQNVQDTRGNTIQQITCQDQSANICSSNYYEYYLNTSNVVDPRNDVMTASRDGRSASATDNTFKTTYGYDAKGNPLTTTDPLGRVTATTFTDGTTVAAYDAGFAPAGLPSKIVNAAGGVQTIVYYANGDVAKTISPAGETTTYTYDNLGRKLTETDTTSTFPNGRTSSFTYDARNRVLTQSDAPITNRVTGAVHTPVTTNVYDDDGNMTSQTIADTTGGDVARTETVTINAHGQKESQTDAVGKTTSFAYDAYGQVISETDSDGGVTAFEVDAEGNVLSETMKGFTGDPNSPTLPRDVVTESRQYDPAGRLASVSDAMGRTTAYKYTDDGMVATVTVSDGTSTFVREQNSYDAAGNLTTQVTGNGATTTTFEYDGAGRQVKSTLDPGGLNRVTVNDLSADDNVVSTTQTMGTGNPLSVTDYAYDAEGRIRAETAYNGDPSTTPVGRWKLNQTAGTTVADSSGNSPATASGVTWSTSAPTGLNGSATLSGASTSRILTDGPVLDTTRAFTVSAWAKLTSKTSDQYVIAQQGTLGSSSVKIGYLAAGDKWTATGLVRQADGTTSWWTTNSATGAPVIDAWAHLAVVVDPATSTAKLFVNGSLVATATVSNGFNNQATGQMNIGSQYGSSGFVGGIADVQTYQRALSATQVSAVYGGTGPATGAGVSRTSYTLDQGGLATRTVDSLGNATDITYDEGERPAITTAAAVTAETASGAAVTARPVTYAGYDTFGDQTETVDGNGNKTTYVYDRAGRVYETHRPSYTTPDGLTTVNPVSSVVYDTLGQQTSTTDELGKVTSYTYDQLGRLAKTVAPNGGVTTATYDMDGEPLSVTDPTGAVSSITYDFLGRKKTTTQAVRQTGAAYTTNFDYDTAGQLKTVTTPAGVTQNLTYNAAGEQLTRVDGVGATTTSAYDGLGRVVKVTQPDNAFQTTTYDMLSRATAKASYEPGGTTPMTSSSQSYDAAGNTLSSTDGRGTVTTYSYDPTGLLLSEKQPISTTDSITTSFGYDLNGNPTRFTDGRGNAFWTTYNSWNLPESTIEPATPAYSAAADRTYTTAYDAAGRAVSQAEPGGVVQNYSYNSVGNLTAESGSGAAATTTTRNFDYDLAGRMTSFSAPTGSNTVAYDDRGLPTSITGPSGNSSFSYTPDGLMASRTDAAGTTSYTYDTNDRLATLTNPTAGTSNTYAYDSTSAIKTITYGGTGNTRNFTYDGIHRMTGDELKTSTGTSIAKIAYGWDANGNETSKTTTNFGGTTTTNTYGYDLADRLTSWNNGTTTVGYTYDKSGNRTGNGSTTYTYDARNRLISDSTGVSYGYTARGTLQSVNGPSGSYTTTSDAFDQAITQSYAGGTRTYSYDALGRVLQPGFSYTGTGNDLAADQSASYVRDPDNGVVGVNSGGVGRQVWTDLHDDVVGQFTATGGMLAASTVFDPLGTIKSASGMLGSLGYQSEWTDNLTGRINMASRWYNTATGQFDSRDTASNSPVPDSINANRYQYGDANPLTVTDPTGHWGWWNKVTSVASSAFNTVTSYASQAYSWASSYVSYQYERAASSWYGFKAWGLGVVAHAARKVGLKGLAKRAERGRKRAAHKAREHHRRMVKAHRDYQRKGHALKERVHRAVHKIAKVVKDASRKTVKWVRQHKKQIITVAAVVATIAATVALGPVGGIVAGIAINVAKDAAIGNIHSLKDLAVSAGTGALTGVLGAVTGGVGGVIGGKIAGMAAAKFGAGMAGRALSGAIGGGITGGIGDAAEQMATTGHVNLRQTAQAVGTGALIGAVTGGRSGRRSSSREAEEASAPSRCHSFAPQTRVVLADGSTKPIGEVKLGDKVLSTDPKTGATASRPVSVLHHNHDADLADVRVKDDKTGKQTVLHTTWHHPFWNAGKGVWTEAQDLKAGDKLRSPDGETSQTVAAVKVWTGLKWMDDLTVNDIHTYYVLAGTTPVLVHNNNREFCQLPLFVLRDGEASTQSDVAASSGGPTAGRAVPRRIRQQMLAEVQAETPPGQTPEYQCWRCGQTTTNPANVQIGHRNVARANGGNLNPENLCIEGAACNSNAQNRGGVDPGMSCADRGGCGAGYGRFD